MMKKFQKLIFLLMAFTVALSTPINAQTPKAILDATSKKISSGGIEASFIATSFVGKSEQGSASGTIYIKGTKFHINSPSLMSWFDGKTLWTHLKNSDEVNISTPSATEVQTMNPYYFINLYKNGYNLTKRNSTIRGNACYEIKLLAQDKRTSISEMLIDIDPQSYLPLCIRIRQGSNKWTRISVRDLKTGKRFSETIFKFSNKQYPKLEVIDLR